VSESGGATTTTNEDGRTVEDEKLNDAVRCSSFVVRRSSFVDGNFRRCRRCRRRWLSSSSFYVTATSLWTMCCRLFVVCCLVSLSRSFIHCNVASSRSWPPSWSQSQCLFVSWLVVVAIRLCWGRVAGWSACFLNLQAVHVLLTNFHSSFVCFRRCVDH